MCDNKEPGYTCEGGGPSSPPPEAGKGVGSSQPSDEFTPTRCSEVLLGAIPDLSYPNGVRTMRAAARALRGLCQWLERVYGCVEKRLDKLEGDLKALLSGQLTGHLSHTIKKVEEAQSMQEMQGAANEVIFARTRQRLEKLEQWRSWVDPAEGVNDHSDRLNQLEEWRNGAEGGSNSEAVATRELVISEQNHRRRLLERVEKLEKRFEGHIRGDIVTPFGNLFGRGPLFHEKHPHPGQHIKLNDEQTERLLSGETGREEIIEEILGDRGENLEGHRDLIEKVLDSQVMRDVCGPDLPFGPESKAPRFCHQCGVRL